MSRFVHLNSGRKAPAGEHFLHRAVRLEMLLTVGPRPGTSHRAPVGVAGRRARFEERLWIAEPVSHTFGTMGEPVGRDGGLGLTLSGPTHVRPWLSGRLLCAGSLPLA